MLRSLLAQYMVLIGPGSKYLVIFLSAFLNLCMVGRRDQTDPHTPGLLYIIKCGSK